MLDPNDPPHVQIEKQQKIIEALVRRANRQRDVGSAAFQAFQSALELKETIAAQSRDLERAATQLESARYERERSRRLLAEALASMQEGFALFSDGQLELCNDLFRKLLPDLEPFLCPGLDLESYVQLLSRSPFFVTSDQPLSILADDRANAVSSTVVELTGHRWYQMNVQRHEKTSLIVLITDITALVRRNRDEKETLIDRQATYLEAVFRNLSSGICTFSPDDDLMMHNGRFCEILGVSSEQVEPGTRLSDLLSYLSGNGIFELKQGTSSADWRRTLRDRGTLRWRVQHRGGSILDLEANRLPDGGFVIEVMDVTLAVRAHEELEERVRARTTALTQANEKLVREYQEKAMVEEALRHAKERAEAAVSSKTRFLAAASHDLLQPINAAKLWISTLREMLSGSETAAMVERLDSAFGSAENLLHSLLDISRLESPDPNAVTPTDMCLGPVLESIYTDQSPLAEQQGVTLDMVPCNVFVRSDPVYLLRSIQNLVVNAIQYTRPGGRVLVGCRRRAGRIVLEVWDTGIGIARKDQARIFEEFARAQNVGNSTGMGLGLSVVERACRHLGHRLDVRSAPGKGSVFSIEMAPVASPVFVSEPVVRLPMAELGRIEHIVLVIENDVAVLDGMTRWLEQWGANVLAAQNEAQALEFVADMGMAPDIILADYQLDHGETGVDAIAHIRDVTRTHVPAILITANRSKSLWRDAHEADISVMNKPAKLTRLRAIIQGKVGHTDSLREA